MNLKDKQEVDYILDSPMSCSDMLQVLEGEHDLILVREARGVIDIPIRELVVDYCREELCPLKEEGK